MAAAAVVAAVVVAAAVVAVVVLSSYYLGSGKGCIAKQAAAQGWSQLVASGLKFRLHRIQTFFWGLKISVRMCKQIIFDYVDVAIAEHISLKCKYNYKQMNRYFHIYIYLSIYLSIRV